MKAAVMLVRLFFIGTLLALTSACANGPAPRPGGYYGGRSIHYESFPATSYGWAGRLDVGRPYPYRRYR